MNVSSSCLLLDMNKMDNVLYDGEMCNEESRLRMWITVLLKFVLLLIDAVVCSLSWVDFHWG